MRFEKGMKAAIKRQRDVNSDDGPGYVGAMREHEGELITLPRLREEGMYECQSFCYKGYTWLTDWVIPLDMENV